MVELLLGAKQLGLMEIGQKLGQLIRPRPRPRPKSVLSMFMPRIDLGEVRN